VDANGQISLGMVLSKINKSRNSGRAMSVLRQCHIEWQNSSPQFKQMLPLLQQTCSFVDSLYQNIGYSRKSIKRSDAIKVLVAGGGPVGLMSAIESYANGILDVIVENIDSFEVLMWKSWRSEGRL
jgi:hypothetical protein